jgi:hypothetical protein
MDIRMEKMQSLPLLPIIMAISFEFDADLLGPVLSQTLIFGSQNRSLKNRLIIPCHLYSVV